MLTGKWQAGGRTDGETGGQRLLLFFARTTTAATTTRNKKQKEAGKGNASFVNEISRTNNVKVAHTDPRTLTHTHTHRHTLAQTDARSLSAGSHSPAKSRGRRMHRCEAARQKGQAKGSSSSSCVGSSPQKAKANNAVRCVWVQS